VLTGVRRCGKSILLELKRRGYNIYDFQGIKECDFIVRDNMQTLAVIHVCVELYDPRKMA